MIHQMRQSLTMFLTDIRRSVLGVSILVTLIGGVLFSQAFAIVNAMQNIPYAAIQPVLDSTWDVGFGGGFSTQKVEEIAQVPGVSHVSAVTFSKVVATDDHGAIINSLSFGGFVVSFNDVRNTGYLDPRFFQGKIVDSYRNLSGVILLGTSSQSNLLDTVVTLQLAQPYQALQPQPIIVKAEVVGIESVVQSAPGLTPEFIAISPPQLTGDFALASPFHFGLLLLWFQPAITPATFHRPRGSNPLLLPIGTVDPRVKQVIQILVQGDPYYMHDHSFAGFTVTSRNDLISLLSSNYALESLSVAPVTILSVILVAGLVLLLFWWWSETIIQSKSKEISIMIALGTSRTGIFLVIYGLSLIVLAIMLLIGLLISMLILKLFLSLPLFVNGSITEIIPIISIVSGSLLTIFGIDWWRLHRLNTEKFLAEE